MAAASKSQAAGTTDELGMMNASETDDEDFTHDGCTASGQYHEVKYSEIIPTKSGHEDEMQIDNDRPGSAGTAHSMQLDDEDQRILASTAAPAKQDGHCAPQPFAEGSFISRPDIPGDLSAVGAFAFGKPAKQHMDFQGTRKGPTQAHPASHPGRAREEGEGGPKYHQDEVESPPTSAEMQPAVDTQGRFEPHHTRPPTAHDTSRPAGVKKKRKGKKSSKVPGQFTGDEVRNTATEEVREVSAGDMAQTQSGHRDTPQIHSGLVENDQTPVPSISGAVQLQNMHEDLSHSLHMQSQNNLEKRLELIAASVETDQQTRDPQNGSIIARDLETSAHTDLQQEKHRGGTMNNLPAATVSNQATGSATRVKTKKQSKTVKGPPRSARPQSTAANMSDAEINDYVQILVYKIREQSRETIKNLMTEKDSIYEELQEAVKANQVLGADLNAAVHDNSGLSSTCEEQRAKLVKYESQVKKFKKFVDGVGKDLSHLKQGADQTRLKYNELVEDNARRMEEREEWLGAMDEISARAVNLKDQASRVVADARGLSELELHTKYLEQQLSDKVGLLTEERDTHSKLEKRLSEEHKRSSEIVLMEIRKDNAVLLDKLFIMHAALEDMGAGEDVCNLLNKTLEAVKNDNSSATSSEGKAATTKQLVEALDQKLQALKSDFSTQALQQQIDTVLASLKSIADFQEDRARKEAEHHQSITDLQEQLNDSKLRTANVEGQLYTAQSRENALRMENQQLQAKTHAAQHQPDPAGDLQVRLSEMKTELHTKVKDLETANVNLNSKTKELDILTKANSELESAMQSLREKICELEQLAGEHAAEKEMMGERIRSGIEKERAESLKHSQAYRAQLEMDCKNQIKKLTSDRDRFERLVTPLKAELATSQDRIAELQRQTREPSGPSTQVEELKSLSDAQAKEIESLKASITGLHQLTNADESLKSEIASLQAGLDAERAKLEEVVAEKSSLLEKSNGYLHESKEARKTCEQTKAELSTYRSDAEKRLEKLREEVKEAQEAKHRAEAGQEYHQKSCEAALEEERNKSRKNTENLQTSLARAEAEQSQLKADDEAFRADVEKQWKENEAVHKQQLDDVRGQLQTVEAAKEEAEINKERLVEECRILREQVDTLNPHFAEERARTQDRSSDRDQEGSSRLKVPSLGEGITPSGSIRSTEPRRPRKKVDRNQNTTLDATALPAPDELRPESRAGSSFKALPVDRDQFVSGQETTGPEPAGCVSDGAGADFGDFAMFSDDASQSDPHEPSQQSTQVVEETQLDSLPNFAAFNRGIGFNRMSSSPSMTYHGGVNAALGAEHVHEQYLQHSRHPPSLQYRQASQLDDNFDIYEDSQDAENRIREPLRKKPTAKPHDELEWSQEELDKHTFRKPIPHPNSASKRQPSTNSMRGGSGVQESVPLKERRLETPETRSVVPRSSHSSASHSSSPAYVHPNASRPSRTYSSTPANAAKRQATRSQTLATQDPRLAGRGQSHAPKRKAEDSIVEGYEHERKKRLGGAATATSSATPRFGLRSSTNSQQSARDLPSVSSSAKSKATSSQTRSRQLGGGSARAPGSRKLTKGDEFNARFSRELRR